MGSFVSRSGLGAVALAGLLALTACGSAIVKVPPAVGPGGVAASTSAAPSASAGAAAPAASPTALVTGAPQQGEPYEAAAKPALSGTTHQITLAAKEGEQQIAPGVEYAVWTFDGHAPGPVIRVKQGDTIQFTLRNDGKVPQSMDFHAAQTPWNKNYKTVNPGESLSYTWKANYPGVFLYHCGTAPALMHIANGMYGAIIVD
ncbi:MAG: multicopper oxidase domain-containing protein, partial [Chloroflexota bacterium]|nr:multicopper oxidase domain-containing protein [Chloroflexota bacterium]